MIYKASASMMEPKSPKTPVAAMPEAELATLRVLEGELPLLVEEATEVRVVGLVPLDEPEVGLIPTVVLLTGYGMEVAGVAAALETGTTTDVVWAGAVTVLLIWVVERMVLALAVVDAAADVVAAAVEEMTAEELEETADEELEETTDEELDAAG
jgi:hypothetical protein